MKNSLIIYRDHSKKSLMYYKKDYLACHLVPSFSFTQRLVSLENEDGAEAAAATAGIMMRAMPMNPQYHCDRPFMLLIRDNLTGMILFSGYVVDPTK